MSRPTPPDWDVVVAVPAEGGFARVARTAATTCAVLEGFDVDRLGDVRLLVDEVFIVMLEAGARRIELRLALENGSIVLELTARHDRDGGPHEVDSGFVRNLADVLATDLRIDLDGDPPRFAATFAAD